MKDNATGENQQDPYIRIKGRSCEYRIEVVEDPGYNKGKGKLIPYEANGEWVIQVEHIEAQSMLKAFIKSSEMRVIGSRGSRASMPITWRSPGQQGL